MALCTAWACVEGLESVEFVFASRHGDLERTLELLTALGKDDMLSPTAFSLSVHNSTAGLFSIARGDRARATAMAAGADTLCMGILEGATMIGEGVSRVLVCYADDAVPAPYQRYLIEGEERHPFAVSLLLAPASEAPLSCRLVRDSVAASEAPETSLMRFLVDGAPGTVLGRDQPWRLERVSHAV